jgi:hypothetical protein
MKLMNEIDNPTNNPSLGSQLDHSFLYSCQEGRVNSLSTIGGGAILAEEKSSYNKHGRIIKAENHTSLKLYFYEPLNEVEDIGIFAEQQIPANKMRY